LTHYIYTSGVDFTNILLEAFTRTDPKSTNKNDSLTVFFALLGSALRNADVDEIDPYFLKFLQSVSQKWLTKRVLINETPGIFKETIFKETLKMLNE